VAFRQLAVGPSDLQLRRVAAHAEDRIGIEGSASVHRPDSTADVAVAWRCVCPGAAAIVGAMLCQRCGFENPATAKFCAECGTPLGAAGGLGGPTGERERKVVSVLFADLVGFTARAESLDPEDVHALLAPYHARVKRELERFGGTVEKFIGDAVMALFGASVAHEDDPERAVRAALDIRDWAAGEDGLQVRIGVTTGEALVSLTARPEVGEGMASGDVVNTAARLQSAAPVGEILVDRTTYRATNRVIGYADADPVDAKGKAEPIPVWRPIEALSRLGVDVRQHGGAPLVGRSRELDLLTHALDRVKHSGEPELVTLVGVPGIGKSRLVYELLQQVDREPDLVTWRQGRSLPYGDGVTFWALGEMVKAQAGILETDGAAEAATKLEHTTRSLVADRSEADRVARHLRPLVGLATNADVARDRNEVFSAWRFFLESLAADRPLVLVFEDLHWADDNLLDFIDHLVDWVSHAPMLVVGTARPELLTRRPGWGGGKANAATLSLRSLSDEDTAELVRSLVGRAVAPSDVQHEVLVRAGGNPLYAEEFARMVAERVGRAAHADDLLPESVQGIIAARLDALPRGEKALLQRAAVIGKVFWRGSIAELGDDDGTDLDERLHALERKEFIRREPRSSVSGETEYAFRHVLVRDVAYGQIPRAERARLHVQTAAWLEALGDERADDRAEMTAHHYVSALEVAATTGEEAPGIAARARAALRDAGDRALALNAAAAAAGFYRRALDLTADDDTERPDLLFRRARALYAAYAEEGIERAEEARDALLAVGDTTRAAQAEQMVGRLWWYRGRSDEARAHIVRAVELLGDDRRSEAAVRVFASAARLHAVAAEGEDALRLAREVVPAADELGLDVMRANLAATIGMARVVLGDDGGFEDFERSRKLALQAGELGEAGMTTQNLAVQRFYAGDTARAWELAEEALELERRAGSQTMVAFLDAVLSQRHYYDGDWDAALAEWDRMIADPGYAPPMFVSLLWRRALVRLARADEEGARADVDRAVELGRTRIESLPDALVAAARVHAELGDTEAARRLADEVIAIQETSSVALVPLGAVIADLGLASSVRSKLEAQRLSAAISPAVLAQADGDFARAADIYAGLGNLPEEADSRLRAGRQLVSDGRPDEAVEQLDAAAAFYRQAGASRYLAQAEEALAQARAMGSARSDP
jgi:class 3 adenylate cyclase/tetratricopeptide (TPR) repeat protein